MPYLLILKGIPMARNVEQNAKNAQEKRRKESIEKYCNEDERNINWVECHICRFRGRDLSGHFQKVHKLSKEECLNFMCVCPDKKLKFSGENNPAAGHGGKYSALNKNFVGYLGLTELEIERKIKIVSENISLAKLNSPETNNTKIEYFINQGMSLDDAKTALHNRQNTKSK